MTNLPSDAANAKPLARRTNAAFTLRAWLRKVRRLPYNGLLLRSAGADKIADDYQARCDAYARL